MTSLKMRSHLPETFQTLRSIARFLSRQIVQFFEQTRRETNFLKQTKHESHECTDLTGRSVGGRLYQPVFLVATQIYISRLYGFALPVYCSKPTTHAITTRSSGSLCSTDRQFLNHSLANCKPKVRPKVARIYALKYIMNIICTNFFIDDNY